MVPSNIIQSTLFIRRNLSLGTAFTLDHAARTAFVAAISWYV